VVSDDSDRDQYPRATNAIVHGGEIIACNSAHDYQSLPKRAAPEAVRRNSPRTDARAISRATAPARPPIFFSLPSFEAAPAVVTQPRDRW
jgi:hypothetical protein